MLSAINNNKSCVQYIEIYVHRSSRHIFDGTSHCTTTSCSSNLAMTCSCCRNQCIEVSVLKPSQRQIIQHCHTSASMHTLPVSSLAPGGFQRCAVQFQAGKNSLEQGRKLDVLNQIANDVILQKDTVFLLFYECCVCWIKQSVLSNYRMHVPTIMHNNQ